jgi:hypothetical protein
LIIWKRAPIHMRISRYWSSKISMPRSLCTTFYAWTVLCKSVIPSASSSLRLAHSIGHSSGIARWVESSLHAPAGSITRASPARYRQAWRVVVSRHNDAWMYLTTWGRKNSQKRETNDSFKKIPGHNCLKPFSTPQNQHSFQGAQIQYHIRHHGSIVLVVKMPFGSGGRQRLQITFARGQGVSAHTRVSLDFLWENDIQNAVQPPYPSDLAPADFSWFGHLKGRLFADVKKIFEGIRVIVNGIEKQTPEAVFLAWMEQMRKSLDVLGTASNKTMNTVW